MDNPVYKIAEVIKFNLPAGLPTNPATIAMNIINVLMFATGALAVIFIIVGGIQFATSAGDPKRIEVAKNTITYAVIGLVIAILSFAIVSFVKSQLMG